MPVPLASGGDSFMGRLPSGGDLKPAARHKEEAARWTGYRSFGCRLGKTVVGGNVSMVSGEEFDGVGEI